DSFTYPPGLKDHARVPPRATGSCAIISGRLSYGGLFLEPARSLEADRMTARIIDGVRIGNEIREEVRLEVEALKGQGVQPGLAAVLVGGNPASPGSVRNKIKACQNLGIYS